VSGGTGDGGGRLTLARPGATGPGAGFKRSLSLLGVVALCVGNMVGTSIWTLPASLAEKVGPLGLVSWVVTAAGYALVAIVYASIGTRYPRTGGPYGFAREAFGEFAGFSTMWAYWLSAVIGNAAIATGAIAYIVGFSSALRASVWAQFLLVQVLLWGFCWLNVRGVKQSVRLQAALMFVTVIPMLLFSGTALLHFDARNLTPLAPHGYGAIAAGAALVVWAYSGVESATVPAEEVRSPERTVRLGTMIGYAVATVVFLSLATAVAGVLPNDVVASSPRPVALAAEKVAGGWAASALGIVAIGSSLATLNGWTLMAGRIPVGAAQDGLFFESWARPHPRYGTPHRSLIIGTAINSALCLLYFSSKTLLGVFNFIVLFSVLTTLLPHLYTMAAELMLARSDPGRYTTRERRRAQAVAPLAFAFVMYTIYGVGADVALWGFLAVLAGIPVYIWMRTREHQPRVDRER
jgi:APA family basic amino acid/polyamine antiporter